MYHSLQYHLANKLTWMARQMRSMNDADAIIDWMAAMKAVHDMLVEVLGNKELLGGIWLKKLPTKLLNFSIEKNRVPRRFDTEEQRGKVLKTTVVEPNNREDGMDTDDEDWEDYVAVKPKVGAATEKSFWNHPAPNVPEASDLRLAADKITCDAKDIYLAKITLPQPVREKRTIVKGRLTLVSTGKEQSVSLQSAHLETSKDCKLK